MRIIAGTAKGRILKGPRSDAIRPALDKVKGAIFNILYDVGGLTVLDLFAGTGSVGIEALSRGASRAVFVDAGKESLDLIQANLRLCRFESSAVILKLDLPDGLSLLAKKSHPFDLIFVDPPYDRNLVHPTLEKIVREKILAPHGKVIVEHSPRETIHETSGLILLDQRKYGQTFISFLKGS